MARSNEEIFKNEELFNLLSKHANDILFRFEFYPKPKCTFISDSFERVFGYSKKEFLSNPQFYKKIIFNLYKTIDLQKQTFDLKTHSKYELEKSGVKYLLVYDELKLAQFRNIIYLFQDACRYNVMREKKIKAHAIRVIDILKKEYHLD